MRWVKTDVNEGEMKKKRNYLSIKLITSIKKRTYLYFYTEFKTNSSKIPKNLKDT